MMALCRSFRPIRSIGIGLADSWGLMTPTLGPLLFCRESGTLPPRGVATVDPCSASRSKKSLQSSARLSLPEGLSTAPSRGLAEIRGGDMRPPLLEIGFKDAEDETRLNGELSGILRFVPVEWPARANPAVSFCSRGCVSLPASND